MASEITCMFIFSLSTCSSSLIYCPLCCARSALLYVEHVCWKEGVAISIAQSLLSSAWCGKRSGARRDASRAPLQFSPNGDGAWCFLMNSLGAEK